MEAEEFFIRNCNQEKIVGDIFCTNNSKKIIVFVPGYGGKRSGGPKAMAKELSKSGFNCLIFDLPGCGESEGDFAEKTINDWVADTLAVIDFAEEKGYNQVSLVGTSMGGTIAFEVATKINVESIVLRAVVPDYNERILNKYADKNIEESFNEKKIIWGGEEVLISTVKEFMTHNLYKIVNKVKCPILLIHGDEDVEVDVNSSIEFVKHLPTGKLEIVKGADHSTGVNGDYSKLHYILKNWFSEQNFN